MIRAIIIIGLLFCQISCLRWGSSRDTGLLQSPILLSLTSSNAAIDVYSGRQIIIYKDLARHSNIFIIYCLVSGYGPNRDLVYRFCKEDSCPNEWKETELFSDITMFNYKISRAPNPAGKLGLKLKLQFPGSGVDSSGNFHCEVQDKVGNFMVRSNDIQIRDIYFWSQSIVLNNENTKTIYQTNLTRDKMPATFKCAQNGLTYNPSEPTWYQQLKMSPVEWSICPVKVNYEALKAIEKQTFDKCVQYTTQIFSGDNIIKPKSLSDMSQWTGYVDNDGNLQIYDIAFEQSPPAVTYALMCYIKSKDAANPINTYIQSYNLNDITSGVYFYGTPSTYTIPLKAISPLVQKITLYLKTKIKDNYKNRIFSLIALYQASSFAKSYWKNNGQQLNMGNNIEYDKFSVKFIGDITDDMAGTYTLDVTDGADKLTFTFIVTVRGPPTLVNTSCMPMVKYVMEFESTSFNCTYKNQPQSLALKINSEDIKLGQSLDMSTVSLKKSYAYLSDLNFTIQSVPQLPSDTVTITYSAYNLRKTLGQTQYQDHTVMFFARNEFGLNLKTSSIYVIPRLNNLIDSSPESYNCTNDCTSLVSHKFQCQVQVDKYANRELLIDHYWTVSGHRLEPNAIHQFAPYFTLNPDTCICPFSVHINVPTYDGTHCNINKDIYQDIPKKELTLHPINSNNTKSDKSVKEALKDNFIECHVDLKSLPDVVPEFVYYSTSDPSLKSTMKAKITLDFQPISSAYMYWVVAIILVFVVILLIIVLVMRYFNKNKGETYQLEKLERRHGYNPEKEIQEQVFKPYEREDNEMPGSHDDNRNSADAHSNESENKYDSQHFDSNTNLTK